MADAAEQTDYVPGPDPRIGTQIAGKYTILRRLGEGGMGIVYEGEHKLTRRRAAIKLLHAQFAADPLVVKRFQNEAIAAASIGDPHIVDVLDMDRLPDGTFYMALEFLDGRDFDDLIEKEGPQPVGLVAHIVSQCLGALQKAHDAGIIHRDLKPENLFLIPRGEEPHFVKVLDFGIAKMMDQTDQSMTQTGQTIGTPHFMSPEQLQGSKHLDHRADLYAIGVIMYHALTGRFPFEAETFPLLIMSIFNHPPVPITSYRQDLPPDFIAIVERLLAKHPDHRYASALQLKEALAPYRQVHTAPQMVSSPQVPTQGSSALTGPLANGGGHWQPTNAAVPPTGISSTVAMDSQPQVPAQVPPGSHPGVPPGSQPGIPQGSQPGYASQPQLSAPGTYAQPAQSASRLPLIVALGSLLVALGVVVVVVVGMSGNNETANDTPPPPPVEQPADEGDETVHVQIESSPPGAELFLDGDPIPNPFDGDLPRSREERRLEARLDGHETHRQMLSLRFAQRITVTLEPEEEAADPEPTPPEPVAATTTRQGTRRRGNTTPPPAEATNNTPVMPIERPRPPPVVTAPPPPPPPAGGLKTVRF